jgi:hypothetical protein
VPPGSSGGSRCRRPRARSRSRDDVGSVHHGEAKVVRRDVHARGLHLATQQQLRGHGALFPRLHARARGWRPAAPGAPGRQMRVEYPATLSRPGRPCCVPAWPTARRAERAGATRTSHPRPEQERAPRDLARPPRDLPRRARGGRCAPATLRHQGAARNPLLWRAQEWLRPLPLRRLWLLSCGGALVQRPRLLPALHRPTEDGARTRAHRARLS